MRKAKTAGLNRIRIAALAGAIALVVPPSIAAAQTRGYNIEAKSLSQALKEFGRTSGHHLLFQESLVRGKTSAGLKGSYDTDAALERLLQGTGLQAQRTANGSIVIRPAAAVPGEGSAGSTAAEIEDSEIVVTGSRIKGAPVTSPVIAVNAEQMRDQGKTDLGDIVRAIPQSFGGGQNIGLGGNVPGTSGGDTGGASTINLRGLGSDATLTLINGHRLAYNGGRQGIDVSALPIGIVKRIEIVADGASALYGSDAVAGVANIILKRDYDGLMTSANLGVSTEGGNFRQQYAVTAGRRWATGGFIGSYEFAKNDQILTDQRSFTASRPGNTILPPLKRNAFAAAGHQQLSDSLTFEIDGLYNYRDTAIIQPNNAAGDLAVSRSEKVSQSQSFSVAPSIKLELPADWRVSLSGVYGDEDVHQQSNTYVGASQTSTIALCYCNKGASAELAADGAIVDLPGGPAKVAIGIGYRYNLLFIDRGQGNINTVKHSQDSYYGYGEVSVPIVSPAQGIGGIDRLNASAALRFEHYPGIDDVVTPKLGLIYAPVADLAFKANWGRSFRAPTLQQQYLVQSALLYNATTVGGTTGKAIILTGGNPDLKPERASTWTATLAFTPRTIPGLSLQLGYFSTRYTDRIVTPIGYFSQSLSNPLYAPYVVRNPGVAAAQAAVDNSVTLYNATTTPFDPADVTAIVRNTSVNAGNQRLHGFDFLADYVGDLGEGNGSLAVSVNASYLKSSQTLVAGAAPTQLAGTLFNPPHWRGRASATWSLDGLSLNATASRIGPVEDQRTATIIPVRGQTTLDVTARYAFPHEQGPLRGLEFSLTVQNLFNDAPQVIASTTIYDTTFDTTNYSGVGRYIGIGLTKAW